MHRSHHLSPLRISLAINAMGRGGAEIQARDCALALVRRGHRVQLTSMLPIEEFGDELRAGGVEVVSLGMKKGKASAKALLDFIERTREFRPHVIHAHMFAAILLSRVARAILESERLRGHQPPVLVETAHTPHEASRLRYVAYRLTNRFSNLWTCVCREGIAHHERYGAVPRGKGILAANGIDTATFRMDAAKRHAKRSELGCADGTFIWLAVGSFRNEQKDYSNILSAFARVSAESARPTRLLIAGHGVLLDEKKKLAADLGLTSTVSFLGLRGDIAELMQASDGYVMGSAWEAMPIVLLEAGASGLPSVVTDVGQNAELVVDAEKWVAAPKDSRALSSVMLRLMALSDADREALGRRTREHVASAYELDVVVGEWERRYREVLAQA